MDNTEEFYKAIDSLKELINTKFEELEKRFSLINQNIDLKISTIIAKDAEQDTKIRAIEDKLANTKEENTKQKVEAVKAKSHTWEVVKDSIIRWLIPFLFMAAMYYISKGGKS
jgi:hypothetical protein